VAETSLKAKIAPFCQVKFNPIPISHLNNFNPDWKYETSSNTHLVQVISEQPRQFITHASK
jgi:hypothetical protein